MKGIYVLYCYAFVSAITGGWVGGWYIGTFTRLLDLDTIGLKNIIGDSVGFLSGYLTIKYYSKPSIRVMASMVLLSYIPLGVLYFTGDPNSFTLVDTILMGIFGAFTGCFTTTLLSQNLIGDERKKYDDVSGVLQSLGLIIGGGVFMYWRAEHVSALQVWLWVFVIFDILTLCRILAIWKGWLKYER